MPTITRAVGLPWTTPILAADIEIVDTSVGRVAGEIIADVLYTEQFPNLRAAAYSRADATSIPPMTSAEIDGYLAAQVGSDWAMRVSQTLSEIATLYNGGCYGVLLEVLCEAGPGGSSLLSGFNQGGAGSIIVGGPLTGEEGLGSGQSMSADGGEGGTLSIEDAAVVEGGFARFKLDLDIKYFNGFSITYTTVAGSADGGTSFCNGDFAEVQSTMEWADGAEGDRYIDVLAFRDYLGEPNETFQVQISNLVNADGGEGDVSLARSAATATISDASSYPIASIGTARVLEGNTVVIPVTLDRPYQEAVTVNWQAVGITAQAGTDFSPTSGSVTFAP